MHANTAVIRAGAERRLGSALLKLFRSRIYKSRQYRETSIRLFIIDLNMPCRKHANAYLMTRQVFLISKEDEDMRNRKITC